MKLCIEKILPQEWITDSKALTIKEGTVNITCNISEAKYMTYVQDRKLFKLQDHLEDWEKQYEILCEGEIAGKLKIRLGIVKYYEDGSIQTDFYPLNEKIVFRAFNIEACSIVFEFREEGKFILKQLTITIEPIDNDYLKRKVEAIQEVITQITPQTIKDSRPTYAINMGVILDPFSLECFSCEAYLIPLMPENWKHKIDEMHIKLLFVESAWEGAIGEWRGKIATMSSQIDDDLAQILKYCQIKNIPTIFWNKEGLINFNYFKEASRLFEYIFVTDERLIPIQKEVSGHEKVYLLPFAAQPRIHNPIEKYKYKLGDVAFAGTWYGDKHPQRLEDMEVILKPAFNFQVDIYDRNYPIRQQMKKMGLYWPPEYRPYIVGHMPYHLLNQIYKYYTIFLNVNSIKESENMIARRVYELLMTKTAVISTSSLAIEKHLKEYVYIPKDAKQTLEMIEFILNNPLQQKLKAKKAMRHILRSHTYTKRIEEILDRVNVAYTKKSLPTIAVIIQIQHKELIEHVIETILIQTHVPTEVRIIVCDTNNMEIEQQIKGRIEDIRMYGMKDYQQTQILESILRDSKAQYFCLLREDFMYGEHYIEDILDQLEISKVDMIGKNIIFEYDEINQNVIQKMYGAGEECYCHTIIPGTMVVKREIIGEIWDLEMQYKDNILKYMTQLTLINKNIYATDGFDVCVVPNIKCIQNQGEHIKQLSWKS